MCILLIYRIKTMSQNPLSKHFRQAVIHVSLPSKGKYWPENTLNMPLTGELPIFPLTVKDEIILKTPDALLNGSGVVQAIQSCVPNIVDAWKMPSIDVDATLIAIRIASYGESMEIEATCPHCNINQTLGINLNVVREQISDAAFDEVFVVDDLRVKFKPLPYFEVNRENLAKFEEDQLLQTVDNDSLGELEKTQIFSNHLNKLIDLNLQSLADSTDYILCADGTKVTNLDFLKEFYSLSNREIVAQIRAFRDNVIDKSKLKPVTCICETEDCKKEFKVNLTFDYASFFE